MSTALFQRLRGLLPQPPVIVGTVLAHHDDDTSTVLIPGAGQVSYGGGIAVGSLIRPRGKTVPVGKKAFVRAGVIETQAPDVDPSVIVIGEVVLPPPEPPPAPGVTRILLNNSLADQTAYHHNLTDVGDGATTEFHETLGVSGTYTVQGYVTIPSGDQPERFPTIFVLQTTYPYSGYLMLRFSREDHIGQWELFSSGGGGGSTAYSVDTYPPGRYHFCCMRDDLGLALWISGERVATLGTGDTLLSGGDLQLVLGTQTDAAGETSASSRFLGDVSSFKVTYGKRLFGESFTPPLEPLLLDVA